MFIAHWWESLSPVMQGFMFAAVPATLVLVIQTVLVLIGMSGDGDSEGEVSVDTETELDLDADTDGDFVPESDFSDTDSPDNLSGDLRIFTVRGFVAFFAIFGWAGAALTEVGFPLWFALFGAFLAGAAAMVLIAWIMKAVLRLQSAGNINPKNSIGRSGVVYITVPKNRSGNGKVNVVVQERYSEMEAVTDSTNDIPTGREVVVVGVTTMGALIVKEK